MSGGQMLKSSMYAIVFLEEILPVSGNRMYYRQQTPNFVPPTHLQSGVVHEEN